MSASTNTFAETMEYLKTYPPAGRPITPVGYSEENTTSANKNKGIIEESTTQNKRSEEVIIVPNPNAGNCTVILPANKSKAEIILTDGAGRMVKSWKGVSTSALQIKNLKPGFYLLNIGYPNESKKMVKKIVVQ